MSTLVHPLCFTLFISALPGFAQEKQGTMHTLIDTWHHREFGCLMTLVPNADGTGMFDDEYG